MQDANLDLIFSLISFQLNFSTFFLCNFGFDLDIIFSLSLIQLSFSIFFCVFFCVRCNFFVVFRKCIQNVASFFVKIQKFKDLYIMCAIKLKRMLNLIQLCYHHYNTTL